MDESWLVELTANVAADVLSTGYFNSVNSLDGPPQRQPVQGLTAAVWPDTLGPVPLNSGLAATSARVVMMVRLYKALAEQLDYPPATTDHIDTAMLLAASALIRRYHDDFDFGGTIRNVDLLGAFGEPLSARTDWLAHGPVVYRITEITVPCIVNDVWTQGSD